MSTSSRIGKAIVALATLAVASATAVVGVVAADRASAAAKCVAVVVDFRQLGGSVQTGCAQGDPSTGLQALAKAGFSYTPRPRDGLICQIKAQPACSDTTTSTYWSYWYRAAGSTRWVYASEGAGTHNPKPGSTEGWVWQDGGKTPPPGTSAATICPQLAGTPSATPKPTKTKSTSRPSTVATTKAAGARSGTTRLPSSPKYKPSPTASSATVTPAASSATTSSAAALSATAQPPTDPPSNGAAADDGGGGGALGGLGGVALGSAVVLGIGAATLARARRGTST